MGEPTLDTSKGHATEAILFGLVPTGDPRTAAEALAELQQLAETAEYVPAGLVLATRAAVTMISSSSSCSTSWATAPVDSTSMVATNTGTHLISCMTPDS